MKNFGLYILCTVALLACSERSKKAEADHGVTLLHNGMSFCESVTTYGDEILVANFGTDELSPLNSEGKGYILAYQDTTARVLIPADGNLSAPKGMLIKDNHLIIADVGKLVVYDLATPTATPQIITMPGSDLMVNDLALSGNTLYVTVTNTGNIYTLDVTNPAAIDPASVSFYTNIVGANGIVIRGSTLYVASYPADGVTTDENLIYLIENIHKPTITPLSFRMGQYDGLALSESGDRLYFTNWVDNEVGYVSLPGGEVTLLDVGVELAGPARLIFHNSKLYIPDLPNSRVVVYPL